MVISLWWCIVLQRKLPKSRKSQNLNHKKFRILPASVRYPPDEIYEIYVVIDDNLQLNFSIYNALVAKAYGWFIFYNIHTGQFLLFYVFIFP